MDTAKEKEKILCIVFISLQEQPDEQSDKVLDSSDANLESPQEHRTEESDAERTTTTSTHHRRPAKRSNTLTEDVLKTVNDHFKRPRGTEDRFDIYGKNVGMKLRELPKQQRVLAEKIINEVLFLAEVGNLTMSHSVKGSDFINTTFSTQPYTETIQSQYQYQPQPQYQFPVTHTTPKHSQFQSPASENSAASYLSSFSDE